MKNHIFISYSRQDKDFVDRLRADLEQSGVTVWIDTKGIRPGAFSWEEVIREAIEHAFAVLLIASPDARKSPYVKGELAIAQMYNHPVYPIWAAGKDWIDCVPMNMAETQHIDARDGKYPAVLSQIVEALGGARPELALTAPEVPDVVLRNPYKGLLAFTEDDKEFFFGREKLTDTLAEALDSCFTTSQPKLIAVVGASGSGKSSVVMAGLLPRLDKKQWHVLRIVPGTKPLDALMYALADVYDRAMTVIEEDLQNPNGLGLHRIARRLAKSGRVLLFVDQFEEVFTLAESEYQRRQFLNLLTNAAIESDSVLATVLTMRADYYERPMNYPQFGELVQNSTKSVMAMSLLELLEAIEQPAMRVGLRFESGIVTEMVNELRDRAGALPLLQFTLNQLYEKRAGNTLTRAAYTEIGGVQGAIGHHADEVFDALPQETQDALPRVAAKLVNIDESAMPTRRRAMMSEFEGHEASQKLVDALVNARLLIAGKEDAAYVEVSHEALLTHWGKLVVTLEANKEGLRQLARLQADAREWERLDKPKEMQWSHERLTPIYMLCDVLNINLDTLTKEFARPEAERLFDEFKNENTPDYRKRVIIEDWIRIGGSTASIMVDALHFIKDDEIGDVEEALEVALAHFSEEAFPHLIYALADSSEFVRVEAITILGEIGKVGVVEKLLMVMEYDYSKTTRQAAVTALAKIGSMSAHEGLLVRLAQDEDEHIRDFITRALGQKGNEWAIDGLSVALAQDKDVNVRRSAARALGEIGDKRAVDGLLTALAQDKDVNVRRSAARALGEIGDKRAVDGLLTALAQDKSKDIRDSAARALGEIGDKRAVDGLLTVLAQDKDANMRSTTARALGEIGDKRAVDGLLTVLTQDKDANMRSSAARALGEIGDKRAVDELLTVLAQDKDAIVRSIIITSVAKFHDARIISKLLQVLQKDEEAYIRQQAAEALGILKAIYTLPYLIQAMGQDSDNDVQTMAAWSLTQFDDFQGITRLIPALKAPTNVWDDEDKQQFAAALEKWGTPEALEAVRQWRASQEITPNLWRA